MKHEALHRDRSHERRLAWKTLPGRATMGTVALMGGHQRLGWPAELVNTLSQPRRRKTFGAADDRLYFRHRSLQERQAAREAAGVEARKAHEELSARYAELSQHGRKRSVRRRSKQAPSQSRAMHDAKRQDALLDQGLTETFPASDPVSVAHVS